MSIDQQGKVTKWLRKRRVIMKGKEEASWYVVLTKPLGECQAESQLKRQGYEVWLPLLSVWKKPGGRWLRKDIPFFPRYLFVRPASPEQSIAPIRSTLGVTSLVRFGHEPARLCEDGVARLREVLAAHAVHPEERISPFVPGEMVAITGGPLLGLAAVVSRPAIERVAVLLTLLGREKEVVLDVGMLSKVA
jgi:transcriptional antiterminator RfaH